jgi:16S rRNA (cytidine1402-2'-O)-methyltransferase
LYVVATPIGNLGDFSPRAREILGQCALIAAEDTRHSGVLLRHFGISTPLLSLHDHNEEHRAAELIPRLLDGAGVALISDAGTPAISDPGYALISRAAAAGIEIVAVPGPCAAIAALSVAGLPTARYCFEGFLPQRSAARLARLQALCTEERTLVFYESPHRIGETLADALQAFGPDRPAVIARELTKLHETLHRGTLGALNQQARNAAEFARGEIVLLIAGAAAQEGADTGGAELTRVLRLLLPEMPLKQAAGLAARITGARDNEAYKRALEIKSAAASQ